jgi:hypothetical protein
MTTALPTVSPASLLWTPRILHGNEGLPVECAPDGPAKYFWVLGRSCFETFLRSACLEWLRQTLCSYARYLGVSTLHTFKINIVSPASWSIDYKHCNFSYDPSMISSFDASFKTLLGILGYWALLFKASSRSALPDSLQPCWEIGVSLHFVRSRP